MPAVIGVQRTWLYAKGSCDFEKRVEPRHVFPPLQRADRPSAQAGHVGEGFLRQPGLLTSFAHL